ncbi:hypothetical protein EDD17DRAFT_1756808 [Pisolithus thermaeus]|nr:hypothetical protein EDD17DRAFT_1756808 [Pisolithus thermaeus]
MSQAHIHIIPLQHDTLVFILCIIADYEVFYIGVCAYLSSIAAVTPLWPYSVSPHLLLTYRIYSFPILIVAISLPHPFEP